MNRKYPPLQPKDEFKRLVLISLIEKKHHGEYWLCICACGELVRAFSGNLRKGRSGSCGCLRREVSRGNKHGMRHGESGVNATPEYLAWCSMMRRCYSPNAGNYAAYGGAGITVCARWHIYENFLADMGRMPQAGMTPDRYPNKVGNYEPDNCRWATDQEQARNKTNNVELTINNKTQCIAAWVEETGIASSTIHNRIKRGWPLERLLEPPRTTAT